MNARNTLGGVRRQCLLALILAVVGCARSKPPRIAMYCDEGMVSDSSGRRFHSRAFCRDSLGRVVPPPSGGKGDTTTRRDP